MFTVHSPALPKRQSLAVTQRRQGAVAD